jgi:hypothetical protein
MLSFGGVVIARTGRDLRRLCRPFRARLLQLRAHPARVRGGGGGGGGGGAGCAARRDSALAGDDGSFGGGQGSSFTSGPWICM